MSRGLGDVYKRQDFLETDFDDMTREQQLDMISKLEEQMKTAAKKLDFEQAATLRDTVMELKAQIS